MKISTESWHYKFLDAMLTDKPIPDSICPYVRAVVGNILMIVASVLTLIFLLTVIGLASKLVFGFNLTDNSYLEALYFFLIGLGFATLAGFLFAGGFVLKNKHKQTGLVFEYIKAKKEKICPKIDFE